MTAPDGRGVIEVDGSGLLPVYEEVDAVSPEDVDDVVASP